MDKGSWDMDIGTQVVQPKRLRARRELGNITNGQDYQFREETSEETIKETSPLFKIFSVPQFPDQLEPFELGICAGVCRSWRLAIICLSDWKHISDLQNPAYPSTDDEKYFRAAYIDKLVLAHLNVGQHDNNPLAPPLTSESFHTAVSIADRYLASENMPTNQFKFVFEAALFMALKIESIYFPWHSRFMRKLGNERWQQVLSLEACIWMKLGYNVIVPTADELFTLLLHAANGDQERLSYQVAAHFGQYLAELAMGLACVPSVQPAIIAASCARLTIARFPELNFDLKLLVGAEEYPKGMEAETKILLCAKEIMRLQQHASEAHFNSTFRKFSTPRFDHVANIPPPCAEFVLSLFE